MFCSNCGKQISDDTKFCPYCGYQIAKDVKKDEEEHVQPIELTSKKLKGELLLAVAVIIVGFVILGSAKSANTSSNIGGILWGIGSITIFVGIVWVVIVKVKIWWHHK